MTAIVCVNHLHKISSLELLVEKSHIWHRFSIDRPIKMDWFYEELWLSWQPKETSLKIASKTTCRIGVTLVRNSANVTLFQIRWSPNHDEISRTLLLGAGCFSSIDIDPSNKNVLVMKTSKQKPAKHGLTLCMLGNFFKYSFLSKDAKNHGFLPNTLLIYNLNVKQFGSQMKPHILWGFIWI